MKKVLSVILVLSMMLSLAACGSKGADGSSSATVEETAGVPAQQMPASALEILENIWANYAEDEKFAVIGGDMVSPVDGAPGSYDIADENITYSLLIPEDQLANITEAASMIHMMNANTFTCGVFKLADGVTAADFGEAMRQSIQNNQWMCGFPDSLLISNFGDTYVLAAFGVNDAMTPFEEHLRAVYPGFEFIASEAIG